MDKIEYAKKLLSYFGEHGIHFDSSLKDKDYREIEKQNKTFKFLKTNEVEITEELASQIINFDKIREYKSMLDSFYEDKIRTENGFLMFTYKVTPDYDAANIADLMRSTCKIILNIYKQKKDTPLFDKRVDLIVDLLDRNIEKEPVGDYGVVFGYIIEKTPQLSQEDKEKLIEFQYRTFGPEDNQNF